MARKEDGQLSFIILYDDDEMMMMIASICSPSALAAASSGTSDKKYSGSGRFIGSRSRADLKYFFLEVIHASRSLRDWTRIRSTFSFLKWISFVAK